MPWLWVTSSRRWNLHNHYRGRFRYAYATPLSERGPDTTRRYVDALACALKRHQFLRYSASVPKWFIFSSLLDSFWVRHATDVNISPLKTSFRYAQIISIMKGKNCKDKKGCILTPDKRKLCYLSRLIFWQLKSYSFFISYRGLNEIIKTRNSETEILLTIEVFIRAEKLFKNK